MKKTLALILGVLMLMGCLSVSAANSALNVTETPAKAIYFEDFSGATLDTTHVTLGGGATLDTTSGKLVAENGTAETDLFNINVAPEGITEPVYFEFDVSQTRLKDVSNGQIKIHIHSTKGEFMQFRWYNAAAPFIRSMGGWSSTGAISYQPTKDFPYGGETARFKILLNPAAGTFKVWINDTLFIDEGETGLRGEDLVPYLYSTTNFTDLLSFKVLTNSASLEAVKLDNIKVYPASESPVPVVGEEIYRQTFDEAVDTFTATSNEIIPAINSNVTYTQANGALRMSTTDAAAGTNVYLQPNQQALTGKYVVEMVLKNASQTTYNDGYHRITFGSGGGGTYYLQWIPNKVLQFRLGDGTWEYFTERMAELKANGTTLKVTQCYDTDANTATVYINDVLAYTKTYTDATKQFTSYAYINFNLYRGQTDIADLRVYRPLTFDSKGLSITEDANSVKIATNAAKDGRLYFATYTGEDDAKTVSALGTTALSLAPGKIYTISKADWEGAKAFFWNNNQQPIVDAWDLQ